jgi:hypothetical protein
MQQMTTENEIFQNNIGNAVFSLIKTGSLKQEKRRLMRMI